MTQSESQTPDRSGSTIGPYELTRLMGRGGMGEVYEAIDTRLDRVIAVKLLRPEVVQDATRKARFEREAKALAALKHPSIVTIYSIETIDDVTLITMELVKGKTLSDILKNQSTMSVDDVLSISLPVADALGAAHKQGIVHRDIKPDNIIVGDSGEVTVLDFGLAKLATSPFESTNPDDVKTQAIGETVEGRILGTVHYMSPEQAQGQEISASTDVFSLGVVLYEMSTGTSPFEGETTLSRLSSLLRDDPVHMQTLNKEVPQEMSRVVKRCLKKDPDRRWQTAIDVRNELDLIKEEREHGIDGETETGATTSSPSRLRQLAMFVLMVGIAALAYFLGSQPNSSIQHVIQSGSSIQPVEAVSILAPDGFDVLDVRLSPDGRTVAMQTIKSTSEVLNANSRSKDVFFHLRRLGEYQPTLVKSSAGAIVGRFSPDSSVFLYLSASTNATKPVRVMRQDLTADVSPVQVTSLTNEQVGYFTNAAFSDPRGFCFLSNETIVLTSVEPAIAITIDARSGSELSRTELDFEQGQRPIQMLEALDSQTILLSTDRYAEGRYLQEVYWANVNTGEVGLVLKNSSEAALAEDSTLLFTRGETLYKIGFDKESKTINGTEHPVLSNLRTVNTWSGAQFSISDNGSIAFLEGGIQGAERSFWKTDGSGVHTKHPFPLGAYEESFSVSDDGQTLLVTTTDLATGMWNVSRGSFRPARFTTRLSFKDWDVFSPLLSPNGQIGLATKNTSYPVRQTALVRFRPSHSASPEVLLESTTDDLAPMAVNSNTNEVLFTRNTFGDNKGTLEISTFEDGSTARVLIPEHASYIRAAFSPDGKMLALISDLAGQPEAYVARYGTDGTLSDIALASPHPVNALAWTDEGGGLMVLRMMSDNVEYSCSVSAIGQEIRVGSVNETGRNLDKQTFLVEYDGVGNVHSVRKGDNEKPVNHVQLMTNWLGQFE
ncbi:MAG: serine/threonine protein kinase [Phycisphaerales bacterium]|nr:serine/threonine protein kinase [Phycisphaerales bacterium]